MLASSSQISGLDQNKGKAGDVLIARVWGHREETPVPVGQAPTQGKTSSPHDGTQVNIIAKVSSPPHCEERKAQRGEAWTQAQPAGETQGPDSDSGAAHTTFTTSKQHPELRGLGERQALPHTGRCPPRTAAFSHLGRRETTPFLTAQDSCEHQRRMKGRALVP